MRTVVISDLHLGSRTGADILRDAQARAALARVLRGADRLVLLGDALELRHGPAVEAIEAARPALETIGDALHPGAEVVLVPGNHDHALLAPWHEHRALAAEGPLGLSATAGPEASEALGRIAEHARPARLRAAYPGVWLRSDVFALHGHFLDCHITVPTFERLAAGFMARAVGPVPQSGATVEDYEAALAPLYAWLHVVARHPRTSFGAERAKSMQGTWRMLTATGRRPLRHRLAAAGWPLAVRALSAAGAGPLKPELSGVELRRAGLKAMHEVTGRLGIDARWVLFGHTHRAGPLPGDDPAEWGRLVNTGCWVHEPTFAGSDPRSPYRAGTYVELDGTPGTPPRVRNVFSEAERRPA